MEEEKLKLSELLDYYVKRYRLDLHENDFSINSRTYKRLRRVLKDTKILERSIWDSMGEKGKKGHTISVKDFELLCFPTWAKYLGNAFSDYEDITKKVHADLKLWEEARSHEAALAREAEGYVKAHKNALVEEFPANIILSDDSESETTPEQLFREEMKMTIGAILGHIYGGTFQWNELERDLEREDVPSGLDDNIDAVKVSVEARDRLADIKNYISKED